MSGQTTWHEVECGGYAADLELWERLAERVRGPVLELGSGAGRVSLDLARRGRAVWALDRDTCLLEALSARAESEGLDVRTVVADARTMNVDRSFELIIAPMQLIQMLGGSESRIAALGRCAAHLAAPGSVAVAIVESPGEAVRDAGEGLPDVRERDGWVFSSLPSVAPTHDGGLEIRRLRQAVSPSGELRSEHHTDVLAGLDAQTLCTEAEKAGLALRERAWVAPADGYLGSRVLVFGKA